MRRAPLLRQLAVVLSVWPSWRFLAGIAGAVPVGSLLAVVLIRRPRRLDVVLLATFAALLFAHVRDPAGLVEESKLLVGPLLLLFFRETRFEGMRTALVALIWLFFLEALIGRLASGELRSLTFLTLEPSHSARAFYAYLLLHYLTQRRRWWTLAMGTAFFAFNNSLSAVVIAGFLVAVVVVERFDLRAVVRLALAGAFLAGGILGFAATFPGTRVADAVARLQQAARGEGTNLAVALNTAGGPRIALSVAAFALATPWGHGVATGTDLPARVEGTTFDFTSVAYIMNELTPEPASYLSQLAFEVGWLGVAVLLLWLALQWRPGWHTSLAWAFGLLQLALFSTTTMPTPWLLLALSARPELFAPRRARSADDAVPTGASLDEGVTVAADATPRPAPRTAT